MQIAINVPRKFYPVITRALTNTVGGEYECIHDYRVTNTNAKYSWNAS